MAELELTELPGEIINGLSEAVHSIKESPVAYVNPDLSRRDDLRKGRVRSHVTEKSKTRSGSPSWPRVRDGIHTT